MKVLVHGRIHYTKWIDSMGNDRYGCEIIAEKVDFGLYLPVNLAPCGLAAFPKQTLVRTAAFSRFRWPLMRTLLPFATAR